MTGRNFNFFAIIVIALLTVWTPLLPEIYSEIAPDSTSTKSDTVKNISISDSGRFSYSPADTSGQQPVTFALFGKKTAFWLKVVGAVMIVMLTIYSHYVKDYKPFLGYDELRRATLNYVFKPLHEKMKAYELNDLRFTVMQRKRWLRLTRFVQFGRLVPIYHLGDDHAERDKSLSYWYLKLFCLEFKQGITGHAFLAEKDIFADMAKLQINSLLQPSPTSTPANPGSTPPSGMLSWLHDKNRLGLTNYRIDLLSDLRIIISIYMICWRGRSYRCAGTVNIDTTDPQTAHKILYGPRADEIRRDLGWYLNDTAHFLSLWL